LQGLTFDVSRCQKANLKMDRNSEVFKVIIRSKEEMIEFGFKVGSLLEKGDILLLKGDLGSGKTTFVRGITDKAFSPSFTLVNKYDFKNTKIYHLDFYRLEKPDYNLFMELEEIEDEIIIVEWPKFDLPIFKKATVLEFLVNKNQREVLISGKKSRDFYHVCFERRS